MLRQCFIDGLVSYPNTNVDIQLLFPCAKDKPYVCITCRTLCPTSCLETFWFRNVGTLNIDEHFEHNVRIPWLGSI